MSSDVARYRILKDGSEVTQNDKLKIKKKGPKVTLKISNVNEQVTKSFISQNKWSFFSCSVKLKMRDSISLWSMGEPAAESW